MTTPWALGYAVFSYTGIYDIASPPTTDYATATFVGLIPGAAYHVQSWNYLQYNWGGIGHHQGEFMYSVNGGDLERVTVVAQPTSATNTALSPSVSKTVVARADGTIELKFMRDHLLPSKSAACSNYDPPLANCKADGRHLPLSGLSILPVCQACPVGLTTLAPGAESADACVCSVGSFKTDAYDTNLIAHYGFDGDTRDLQNPGNVATLTGNGGIAYLDTTHKIFGSHSVKLTNDDGLKTYVLIPQFQLDTSLTISLWFRWDVTSLHDSDYTKLFYFSGDVKLYAAGDSSVSGDGEALYFVMYDQNNNRIEYKNSDSFYFSNNVWYHISWVLNRNSDMRIYVDGEYVQRTNTDKLESGKFPLWDASANMNNNRIGTHVSSDDGRDSIDGHVEEFRLYNTALPDSAVKALYEARGATCMSCSSGLTTPAPGANSSDACVCPSDTYVSPSPRFFSVPSGDFDTVQASCKAAGGALASIHNAQEQQEAYNLCLETSPQYGCYIGLRADAAGEPWYWVDSSTVTYTNWQGTQGGTNGISGSETAVILTSYDNHGGEWSDWGTGDSVFSGICRRPRCTSCPVGTTSAAGSTSADQCVCPPGSFTNPLPPAVLHWNPSLADENMDGTSATIHQIPALNWNIASNGGFTIIMKVRVDATSDSYPAFLDISSSTASSGASTFIRIGENGATEHFIFETNDGSAGACGSEWPHLKMTWGAVYTMVATYNQLTKTKGLYYDTSSTFSRTCSSEATMPCERTACTDFTADLQDYVAVIGARARSDRHDSHAIAGKIFGVYGYDEVLTDAQIQTVIDSIVVDGEDDARVLNGGACTACPTEKPYTDPSQGVTAEAQCQAPPDECAAVTPALSANDPYTADVSSGLIAQYQFNDYGSEEGVLDSSGNGKTLTAYNAQYEDFAFKTTDQVDYFEVANDGYFSPQKFTISFWIKLNTGVTALGAVASCRESPGFKGWMIYHNSGNKLLFWTGTSSKWDDVTVDGAFDGTWQHFAITLDGASTTNNVEIFRNKVSLGKHSLGYARALVNNMRIGEGGNEGSISSGWGPLASGSYLDEFRLYDRVLTLSEIEAVHDYRLPVLSGDVTSSMVKYLRFPEGSSPYTLTFFAATTGSALLVDGSTYTHVPALNLSAGTYTVTVLNPVTVGQDDATFDRTDANIVTLASPLTWNVDTNTGFTIITKFRIHTQADWQGIFNFGGGNGAMHLGYDEFRLNTYDSSRDSLQFIVSNGATLLLNLVSTDGTISLNQWHTVVIQYNSNSKAVTMDIDGTVSTGTMSAAMTDRVTTVNTIGKAFWNTLADGNYFDGNIAGFYAWDDFLSSTEVERFRAGIAISGTDNVVTAGESKIVDASGVEVAGSAGGTGYAEEMAYAGVPPASAWLAGRDDTGNALHSDCDVANYFGTESDTNPFGNSNDNAACLQGGTNGWLQLDLGKESYVSGIITQARYHTSVDLWIDKFIVKVSTVSTPYVWTDVTCETVDANGYCSGNTDRVTKKTNHFLQRVKARYVRLYVKQYTNFAAVRMSVLTQYFEHAIAGTLTAYAAPQIVVKYKAIVCPSDTDTEPTCGEGVSVFSYWSIRKC